MSSAVAHMQTQQIQPSAQMDRLELVILLLAEEAGAQYRFFCSNKAKIAVDLPSICWRRSLVHLAYAARSNVEPRSHRYMVGLVMQCLQTN